MCISVIIICLSIIGAAQSAEDSIMETGLKSSNWWEVVASILAIPATLIGIVYSYILIKKTQLDTRKTELEIREKERQLQEKPPITLEQQEILDRYVKPVVADRKVLSLLPRFIILYLILSLWRLIEIGN